MGIIARYGRATIRPQPRPVAGLERVGGRLGPWLEVKDPDRTIEQMLDLIFDSKENNR